MLYLITLWSSKIQTLSLEETEFMNAVLDNFMEFKDANEKKTKLKLQKQK